MVQATQSGMTAQIAAADVDPMALQEPPVARRRLRRPAVLFIALGLIAYSLALVAQIPARVAVHESDRLRVGGTVWHGEAVLASALRMEWHWSPMATLTNLHYTADWRMTGGGTDLIGSGMLVDGGVALTDVSGQADEQTLDAMAPNLPLACRFVASVAIKYVKLGGSNQAAKGTLRTSAANCSLRAVASPSLEVPAMTGAISDGQQVSAGTLATAQSQQPLFELRLTRAGALSFWPTANAVRMMPPLAGWRYDTTVR